MYASLIFQVKRFCINPLEALSVIMLYSLNQVARFYCDRRLKMIRLTDMHVHVSVSITLI
jgi:hypothetical protein